MHSKTKISVFALAMMITGTVDGVSNLPSIALFGQQLIFFFCAGSLFFLLPTGLISAELTTHGDHSGIFHWVQNAFGSGAGALAAWLQWINTMVWFPTCLTTFVGTCAYLINPSLIKSAPFLVCMSLGTFWVLTLLNLKGIKQSTKIAATGTLIGMLIPLIIIIALMIAWIAMGKPLALTLNHAAITPPLSHSKTWTSLTAVISAFLGMELAAVHVTKIKNAKRVFSKALMIAIIIIILTMGFGSLGVALVIPHHNISLVAGTLQAFNVLFTGFHVHWLEGVLGVMLLFGSIGAMVNWLISPANSLAQAAQAGHLPQLIAHENRHGVPYKALIIQACVVSTISLAFFLMPTINGGYWLLMDLGTELYVFMYLLMFIASWCLLLKAPKINVIPGGKPIALFVSTMGTIGCLVTALVGFFPPANINTGSKWHFIILFASGLISLILPGIIMMFKKPKEVSTHAPT